MALSSFSNRLSLSSLLPLIVYTIALLSVLLASSSSNFTNAQQPTCQANQVFNGNTCVCAPGYFDKPSKDRCEDECEEEYFSYFTYGACVNGLFGRASEQNKPSSPCNMKCGIRLYLWATIALFVVIAAAVITLVLLLPMCVSTCLSCLHSRQASKHSKRVAMEQQQQQQQPGKDQQLATYSYNPYSYWPYYGR